VYGEQAKDLKFLDLMDGKKSKITSEESNYETGGYLWSSDGIQLVYSLLTYDEPGEREITHYAWLMFKPVMNESFSYLPIIVSQQSHGHQIVFWLSKDKEEMER